MARPARSVPRGWGVRLAVLGASAILLTAGGPAAVALVTAPRPGRVAGGGERVAIACPPLRGTPADAAAMRHPSIAVKIDNHEDARPQIGLNRTDLVFEELGEGGPTRYVAGGH